MFRVVLYQNITDQDQAVSIANFERQSLSGKIADDSQLSFSAILNKPYRKDMDSLWRSDIKSSFSEVIIATVLDNIVGVISATTTNDKRGKISRFHAFADQEIADNLLKRAELFLVSKGCVAAEVEVFKTSFFKARGYRAIGSGQGRFDRDLKRVEKRLIDPIVF